MIPFTALFLTPKYLLLYFKVKTQGQIRKNISKPVSSDRALNTMWKNIIVYYYYLLPKAVQNSLKMKKCSHIQYEISCA